LSFFGRDSSSNSRIDQVLSGNFERFHCLLLADRREVIEKLGQCFPAFEIVKQCLHRHTGSSENRCPVQDIRRNVDNVRFGHGVETPSL